MRKLTCWLMLVLLGLAAGTVRAQEVLPPEQDSPALETVVVELWPEYDRTAMLVIQEGQFPVDALLPLAARVRIPLLAGSPHAVAFVDAAGKPYMQPYSTEVQGDWLLITFDLAKAPTYRVEYYAPLSIEGQDRAYAYAYVAEHATQVLSLRAQVPPTARLFSLAPAGQPVVDEGDGLTYYVAQAGSIGVGETRSWAVGYQKADDSLTSPPASGGEGSAQVPAVGDRGGDLSVVWIFLGAFVALAAVGLGAFWLGRHVQPPTPTGLRRGRAGSRDAGGALSGRFEAALGDDLLHCPECGARLRADSEFCHKCGTPLLGR